MPGTSDQAKPNLLSRAAAADPGTSDGAQPNPLNRAAAADPRVAPPLPARDLDHVLIQTKALWEDLRGARLFVTGGSGFFGRWMLESFAHADERLGLGAGALVLSRRPADFARAAPHLVRRRSIDVMSGDVRSFDWPAGEFTHVLHLATQSEREAGTLSPAASYETAVRGTERVLGFAAARGARRLLFTSSGAVYGVQPPDCERLFEDYPGAPDPDDPAAGYALGKLAAERLCSAAAGSDLQTTIARCFAFVGPGLPLDANFAVGNFIRDALGGDAIRVNGDGTPQRSYLHAADLAVWLWTILLRGAPARPYNFGSDQAICIRDLAELVARVVGNGTPVSVAKPPVPGVPPARYVPDVSRARTELGLRPVVDLEDAVGRTAGWYAAAV
jgi:nucleoside-diphosphate-sugar epimerase